MEQESIIFTDAAANKVGALLQDEDNNAMHLRVYVTGGGCAGFQYGFSFDKVIDKVMADKFFYFEKRFFIVIIEAAFV